MNPWAGAFILIALAIVVIGVKGNEKNLLAAVTGKQYNGSTLS
jgi:hypothetical protein